MRILLGLLLCLPAFATTTLVGPVDVSNTQAVLHIRTDQTGCTVKVSEVNVFDGGYAPIHDVDTALFSGSDQCSREGNISVGNRWTLVIGRRAVELDAGGLSKDSRALQAVTTYYYSIEIGSDTLTGSFTTGNVPLGLTRNDVHFDRSRPGEYPYPSIDWTSAGKAKKYIDPTTGVALRRVAGPGELFPQTTTGRTFSSTVGGSGWSGSTWTGTGVGSTMYLRASDPSPAFYLFQSLDAARFVATLSGTAPGAEVCPTKDGVSCAGKWISQAITISPTGYTIGSTVPILDSWRDSPVIPVAARDVQPIVNNIPVSGYFNKSGTAITYANSGSQFSRLWKAGVILAIDSTTPCVIASVTDETHATLASSGCIADGTHLFTASKVTKLGTAVMYAGGPLYNSHWTAGSVITLGGTDCTIAALTDEATIVLSDSGCVADGAYDFVGRNFGFLLRATGAGTLTVSSPSWTSIVSGVGLMGSYGSPRMCQPVKYDGGYLCSSSSSYDTGYGRPLIFWLGDDGTANPIGLAPSVPSDDLNSYTCNVSEGVVWDRTVPGRSWCAGLGFGYLDVIYRVDYTGTHAAHIVGSDSFLPDATATVVSDSMGLDVQVAAFTASDPNKFADFSCMYGWRLIGRQGDILLLNCLKVSQDSVAWYAMYDVTTNEIVAATCSYCGQSMAANRWSVSHAQTMAGDTGWTLVGTNPYLLHTSTVTSGTLTSDLSACPSNTVDPSIAGQSLCSTVTLDSLQPLDGGVSLYGQNWELGDTGRVLVNGGANNEYVRFIAFPTGTQVTLQRGWQNYRSGNPGLVPNLDHSGTITIQVQPSVYKEWWWDFIHDPHGLDGTGAYILEDPHSADCHEIFELGTYVVGCLKTVDVVGVPIRSGELPDSFSNSYHVVNSDGGFMGSTYAGSQNCNEHHPSMSQTSARASEQVMVLDLRPQMCDLRHALPEQMSHVTGRIYKMDQVGTTGSDGNTPPLQYRQQGFVVNNGTNPMVDVSPAVLTNTQGDEYKYCVVVIANDCYAGSTVGEMYFNVPMATTGYETGQRFVDYPLSALLDINVTQNSQTLNSLMQVDGSRGSASGEGTRRLSSVFAPFRIQSVYWNGRALPDNSRAYFQVDRMEGVRSEIMVADLPPGPSVQSTNRGTGVPLALSFGGVSGDTIRVRFGYAENGLASDLKCHERQVACATDASGALPYVWTDETQHWAACDSGCTVNVPAISGRVLYYIVDRKNDSTTVSGGLKAVLVP